MKTYQWNAQDYAKHSQAQQTWAKEMIEKLLLNGAESVLDLGCGDGKVAVEIANAVPSGSVIGIDNSQAMIKLASEQYPIEKYPNLSFHLMDACHISFENSFDVVFSNAVLHWVKNHHAVMTGLLHCLKPGGKMLLQMGGKDGVKDYLAVLDEILLHPEWKSYFQDFEFPYYFPSIEDYEVLLPMFGFQINRLELINKDALHDSKETFKGWIRTTWLPYLEKIPAEKKEDFIELLATNYLAKVPLDAEGKVHVNMIRLEVEANKLR